MLRAYSRDYQVTKVWISNNNFINEEQWAWNLSQANAGIKMEWLWLFPDISERQIQITKKSCAHYLSQASGERKCLRSRLSLLIKSIFHRKRTFLTKDNIVPKRNSGMPSTDQITKIKNERIRDEKCLDSEINQSQTFANWIGIKEAKKGLVNSFWFPLEKSTQWSKDIKVENTTNRRIFSRLSLSNLNSQERSKLCIISRAVNQKIEKWTAL